MPTQLKSTVQINDREVSVKWTKSAAHELAKRTQPLIVELELYFACLIKKSVYFHEVMPGCNTVAVNDKLSLFFRPVTSTACSFEEADRLGRTKIEIDTINVRKIAPRLVMVDFMRGTWRGSYWI